jgi:tripartite ATP-independent transporter DctM subunit
MGSRSSTASGAEPGPQARLTPADALVPAMAAAGSGGVLTRTRAHVDRMVRALDVVVQIMLYVAIFGELGVLFGNVVVRNLLNGAWNWSDEIAQIALAVLTYVGGAYSYRRGLQSALEFFVNKMPVAWQGAQRVFVSLAVATISVIVCVVSIPLLSTEWQDRTAVLHIPQTIYIIPIVVGMAILVLYAAAELLQVSKDAALRGTLWFVVVAAACYVACLLVQQEATGSSQWSSIVSLSGFVLLLLMGLPIAFVLLICGTLFLYASQNAPLDATVTNLTSGASNFLLLAIPFFIFAGMILTGSGLSAKLLRFTHAIVGRARGGMLQTVVVTMYVFSGLSGSKVADVAAVGSPIADSIEEHGNTREELAAVLAASAIMGESVPPSIAMIILASVTDISVAGLFAAGILPAAVIGFLLMLTIFLMARRRGVVAEKIPYRDIATTAGPALPVLVIPVLLLVGVVGGIASPTEMSSIAVVAALVLALLYRAINRHTVQVMLQTTVSTAGMVLFIVACASHFSWSLTIAGLPDQIANVFTSVGDSRVLLLLATLVLVPLMGAVLEGMPAVLIFAPILMPIAQASGIDPLQYGVVFVIALGLGTFAPPLGVGLYATCSICRVKMDAVVRPFIPYWLVIVAGVVVLILFPGLSLWLPHHVIHGVT